MINYFVISNFRGTCSCVEIPKGYMTIFRNAEGVHAHLPECMIRERLGNPALEDSTKRSKTVLISLILIVFKVMQE